MSEKAEKLTRGREKFSIDERKWRDVGHGLSVLDINEDQVSADMIAITYDWKSAVARAESNGRHDWANGLRTGWFMANLGRRHFTFTVGTEGHS